jgi:multidrug efflux pump subunit AcrA (membrane-fusion protein)
MGPKIMSVPAWSIAAGTAFVMLSGCGGPTLQTDAAHPVIALPAQATDGAQVLRLPGEVHARYEMPLSFRLAGQPAVRLARLGDTVRKGQLLAKLDDSDPIKTASVARAAIGQPIFDFAWSSERDVYLDVPQDRLAEVSVGQIATVSVTIVPGKAWAGHVREVSPAADPQSRTYRIKIAIDAPDPRTALGMTAEVALPTAPRVDPVRIAATALFHEGDRSRLILDRTPVDVGDPR